MSQAGSTIGSSSPIPGALDYNYTLVNTSPYVIAGSDAFLGVDSSSIAITIELPDAPSTGRVYIIKDIAGNAAANNITVTTVGGTVLIDAATSENMNASYESLQFLFDGTEYHIF